MLLCEGNILWNRPVAESVQEMGLSLPGEFQAAQPGQFLMIRVSRSSDPLLRRPLSIHRIDRSGAVAILYQVRGAGTAALASMEPGRTLSVLGPLGRGFSMATGGGFHVMIGGGIGVAPLVFLAERGAAAGLFDRSNSLAVIGARTASGILAAGAFESLGIPVARATEDGSAGFRGTAVEAAAEALAGSCRPAFAYACGPRGMIASLARALGGLEGVSCQVSVEEKMACGLGACRSCATPVKTPGGVARMAAACTEGPVFDLDSLQGAQHR